MFFVLIFKNIAYPLKNMVLNNNGFLKLMVRTVASAGPSPEQLKKPVDKHSSEGIFSYNGKIYAIRQRELVNLGLDYRGEIDELCAQRGLPDTVFFEPACPYCDNASKNVLKMVLNSGEPVLINNTSKIEWGCNYKGIGVKIAETFRGETQEPFYAVREGDCAFIDSLVSYLSDGGHLKKYEVALEFNFKPISEFEKTKIIPDEFLVRHVKKKLDSSRIIDYPQETKTGFFKNLFDKLF